jgi:hypothetical protein
VGRSGVYRVVRALLPEATGDHSGRAAPRALGSGGPGAELPPKGIATSKGIPSDVVESCALRAASPSGLTPPTYELGEGNPT